MKTILMKVLNAIITTFKEVETNLYRETSQPDSNEEKEVISFSEEELTSHKLRVKLGNSFHTVADMLITFGFTSWITYTFLTAKNPYNPWAGEISPALYIVTLFLFLFPCMGILHFYSFVAGAFNHASIEYRNGSIIISNGPVPWPTKVKEIKAHKIKQIYVQDYNMISIKKPIKLYKVVAVTDQGEQVLQTRLANYKSALVIETWLEKKIELQDNSIANESSQKSWFKKVV